MRTGGDSREVQDRVSIVNTIISDRVAALEREAARRKLERQPITARGLKGVRIERARCKGGLLYPRGPLH